MVSDIVKEIKRKALDYAIIDRKQQSAPDISIIFGQHPDGLWRVVLVNKHGLEIPGSRIQTNDRDFATNTVFDISEQTGGRIVMIVGLIAKPY